MVRATWCIGSVKNNWRSSTYLALKKVHGYKKLQHVALHVWYGLIVFVQNKILSIALLIYIQFWICYPKYYIWNILHESKLCISWQCGVCCPYIVSPNSFKYECIEPFLFLKFQRCAWTLLQCAWKITWCIWTINCFSKVQRGNIKRSQSSSCNGEMPLFAAGK